MSKQLLGCNVDLGNSCCTDAGLLRLSGNAQTTETEHPLKKKNKPETPQHAVHLWLCFNPVVLSYYGNVDL